MNETYRYGGFYQTITMMKILLKVNIIQFQNEMIDILIYIIIIISNESVQERDYNKKESLRNIAMNIFNHIRWNDIILDPCYVVEKLMNELAPSLSMDQSFQIEVISSLPALLPESDHEQLVQSLLDMVRSNPDLVSCIFDTISNLSLPKNSSAGRDALNEACEQLVSGTEKELPVIVRYILEASQDKDLAKENLNELRGKLCEYISIANPIHSSLQHDYDPFLSQRIPWTAGSKVDNVVLKQRSEFLTCINLILNSIKSSFLSNSVLVAAYYKLMEEKNDSLTPVDLWIIFSLYSTSNFSFKMSGILLRKFSLGLLSFETIIKSLASFVTILEDMFRNIMVVANSLLTLPLLQTRLRMGSINPSISTGTQNITSNSFSLQSQIIENQHSVAQSLGLEIYLAIYCSFTQSSNRQDIVAALIGHVASPVDYESRTALCVLAMISDCEFQIALKQNLRASPCSSQSNASLFNKVFYQIANVDKNAATLKNFVPFIQTLVYETNKLSYPQIRSVFRIIFQISIDLNGLLRPDNKTINDQLQYLPDEVLIIMRKYVDKLNLKYKKIGVLGFVSLLIVLSDYAVIERTANAHGSRLEIITTLQQHLFKAFLVDKLSQSDIMQEFVFDELSHAISTNILDDHLRSLILEYSENELAKYLSFDLKRHESTKKMWHDFVAKNRTGSQLISPDRSFIGYGLLLRNDSSMTQGTGKQLASQHANFDQDADNVTYAQILTKTIAYHMKANCHTGSSSSLVQSNDNSNLDANVISSTARAFLHSSRNSKIASIVKLVGKCYRAYSSVDDIGGLLYAPVELPSPNLINVIENLNVLCQSVVCQSYRFAVNWMRELVNTFCLWPLSINEDVISPEIGRLIQRYNSLIDCEREVIILLQRCPEVFKLIFENLAVEPLITTKKVVDPLPKKKKKKSDTHDDNNIEDEDEFFTKDLHSNTKVAVMHSDVSIESDNIELLIEKVYRPMNSHAVMLLGFGTNQYQLFYEGEVSADDVNSKALAAMVAPTSQRYKLGKLKSNDLLKVHLNEKSQMRLLQLLLSSLKAYSKKPSGTSAATSTESDNVLSIVLTIEDILPAAYRLRLRGVSESAFSPTIDKFTSANNVNIDHLTEVEYYVYLECRRVFRYLSDSISTFSESLGTGRHIDIGSSAQVPTSLINCNISMIQKVPGEVYDLDETGNNHESETSPEEMHSKMVLIFSIVDAILESKLLKDIALNRMLYLLEHGASDDMGSSSTLASADSIIPVIFDIFASLAGINYRDAEYMLSQNDTTIANPIIQMRGSDPFRYFQFVIYGLELKLHQILSHLRHPIFFDMMILTLTIVDKLASFLESILGVLKGSLSPDHDLVILLSNTYGEISDRMQCICSSLLIIDWNSSTDTGKSKRRYTKNDLGLIISFQLKYQPSVEKKIDRIFFYIHDGLEDVLPKESDDTVESDSRISGFHHVYKTLSVDHSFNIFYHVLLDELCNTWRICIENMRLPHSSKSKVAAVRTDLGESDFRILRSMVRTQVNGRFHALLLYL